jgi:hypothetical protein
VQRIAERLGRSLRRAGLITRVLDKCVSRATSGAQRLERVFALDLAAHRRCGRWLRVMASIEDRAVIERIPDRPGRDERCIDPAHPGRAPSQSLLPP